MKVVPDTSAPRQTVLTIELDPQEVEPYLERAYRRFAQRLAVPGFRRGKAPRNLVERLVGKEGLLEEALEILAPEVTARAVQEQNIPAGGTPKVEVVERNPITIKATIPLEPLVELNNYQSLRIPLEPVEVKEEDVQRVLENLRHRHAKWEPVARPAQAGDMVVIALWGTVEGKQVFQEPDLPLVLGESGFLLGQEFAQHLLGAGRGEVREFTTVIPHDYPNPDLQGKPCAYRALVKEVKAPVLPSLDDTFARQIDPSVADLEGLKARIRERLQQEREELQRERYRRRSLEALRKQAKVEVPPLLIEREVEHLLEHYQEDLAARGITLQRWLESTGKTLAQVREELYPEAERIVVERYLLERLAQAEGVQVSPEEVDAELQGLTQRSQRQDRELLRALQEPAGREAVARIIARRKALQRLVQIVSQPPEAEPPPQGGETPSTTPTTQ